MLPKDVKPTQQKPRWEPWLRRWFCFLHVWIVKFRSVLTIDSLELTEQKRQIRKSGFQPWLCQCLVLWLKRLMAEDNTSPAKGSGLASCAVLRGILRLHVGLRIANLLSPWQGTEWWWASLGLPPLTSDLCLTSLGPSSQFLHFKMCKLHPKIILHALSPPQKCWEWNCDP